MSRRSSLIKPSPSKSFADAAGHQSPYNQWTVQKLKEELKNRKLTRSGSKNELVQRLQLNDSTSDYFQWTVAALQDELIRRGLPHTGPKNSLVDRLTENDQMPPSTPSSKPKKMPDSGRKSPGRSKKIGSKNITEGDDPAQQLSLIFSPFKTIGFFLAGCLRYLKEFLDYILGHKVLIYISLALFCLWGTTHFMGDPNILKLEKVVFWYIWWVLLGVASSIGLGSGLHTFLLFLGPHIAKVTLTAYECGNLSFDVYGDTEFECRSTNVNENLRLWDIYTKVMFQAFAWGAGTAIGELPPYFVAKAAAMAGRGDEDFDHIQEIQYKPKSELNFWEKIQLFIFYVLNKMGFFGILLCASIPNPFFDLAGISCGHFLIPFATFFGATFIGKAVFKATIQAFSVIMLFSKQNMNALLSLLKQSNNQRIYQLATDFFQQQKHRFQETKKPGSPNITSPTSNLSMAWNTVLVLMILYFLLSMVKSIAVAELSRQTKKSH